MQFAFWAILLAAVMPLLWAVLAKSGPGFDNHQPRLYLAGLHGWRQRAQWAQQNSWEAFAPFAAAVIVAYLMMVTPQQLDAAAAVFLVARLGYGVCYVADWATLRSLCWTAGFGAVVYLFLAAAHLL